MSKRKKKGKKFKINKANKKVKNITIENKEESIVKDEGFQKIMFLCLGLPALFILMMVGLVGEFYNGYEDWYVTNAKVEGSEYVVNASFSPKVYDYTYTVDDKEYENKVVTWGNLEETNNKIMVNPEFPDISRTAPSMTGELFTIIIYGIVISGVLLFLFVQILLD